MDIELRLRGQEPLRLGDRLAAADEISRLRTKVANYEANAHNEVLNERRRNSAYKTLVSSLENELAFYRRKQAESDEAVHTLDSERAANATLTAELAELLAAIEAMRVAGGAAEFQRAFDEAKIIAARKGEGE